MDFLVAARPTVATRVGHICFARVHEDGPQLLTGLESVRLIGRDEFQQCAHRDRGDFRNPRADRPRLSVYLSRPYSNAGRRRSRGVRRRIGQPSTPVRQPLRPAAGFTARNATLRGVIQEAYDLKDDGLLGGPDWVGSERYDINAKPESPVSDERARSMLQTLLVDRFQLKVHHETRLLPGLCTDCG